jgi:hypothetical protein
VLVAGELGELVDVVPHPLVGRVEEVGTVAVHLDTCLGLGLRVGVAADVRPPVEHEHTLVQLGGGAFRHREAEETGSHDHQVIAIEAHGRRE